MIASNLDVKAFVEITTYPFLVNTNEMSTSDLSDSVAQIAEDFAALGVMSAPGQTVADIGSDSGLVGFALIRHVADATCIVAGSAADLDDARGLAAQIGVQDRVTFRDRDVAALDFEADSIDIALLGESIHSLDDEQFSDLLANIRRAIRPGGVLYVAGVSRADDGDVTSRSRLADSGFDDLAAVEAGGYVLRRFALSAA